MTSSTVCAPDARLITTPTSPGLYVYAPDRHTPPRVSYACACGFVRRGIGRDQVTEIVTGHGQHRDHCPLTMQESPCPNCGESNEPGACKRCGAPV